MNTNSVNFNSKKINNKNNNKNQMAISKMKIRIISENNNNNNNNNNNKIPSELKKIINSSISKVNNNKYIYEEKPIFYDRLYDNIKEKLVLMYLRPRNNLKENCGWPRHRRTKYVKS